MGRVTVSAVLPIVEEIKALRSSYLRLRSMPISAEDVVLFLKEAIELVESWVYAEDLDGPGKHALVRGVFDFFDQKFDLREVIYDFLRDIKWLRWIPKGWVRKIADVVVDLLIKAIVKTLNETVWTDPRDELVNAAATKYLGL